MNYSNELNEIKRLNLEDFIWIIFIIIGILNIYGDKLLKDFIKTNNQKNLNNANKIFLLILIITFFIYIYFLQRNYKAYKNAKESEKNLYLIKLLGSSFLLAGIICLLYFQLKQSNFIGTPAV